MASDTLDDHVEHLHLVLKILLDHNVSLELRKAYIGFPEVALLGRAHNLKVPGAMVSVGQ